LRHGEMCVACARREIDDEAHRDRPMRLRATSG
jgi:hypothetical protein